MLSRFIGILLFLIVLVTVVKLGLSLEPKNVTQNPANSVVAIKNDEAVKGANATEGIDYITTNNSTNSRLKYYYYIPNKLLNNTAYSFPVMVVVPGLSGDGQVFTSDIFKDFAEKEGFAIISPTFVFDENDFNHEESYQYPAAWSGDALIAMINNLPGKGINPEKLYLFGFSAGAQFSLRFTLLHPDLVKACASHGNGARIIPNMQNTVNYFITVGTSDDPYRIDNARIFYNEAKELNMMALYKEYNIGHEISTDQINDSLEFFRQSK